MKKIVTATLAFWLSVAVLFYGCTLDDSGIFEVGQSDVSTEYSAEESDNPSETSDESEDTSHEEEMRITFFKKAKIKTETVYTIMRGGWKNDVSEETVFDYDITDGITFDAEFVTRENDSAIGNFTSEKKITYKDGVMTLISGEETAVSEIDDTAAKAAVFTEIYRFTEINKYEKAFSYGNFFTVDCPESYCKDILKRLLSDIFETLDEDKIKISDLYTVGETESGMLKSVYSSFSYSYDNDGIEDYTGAVCVSAVIYANG